MYSLWLCVSEVINWKVENGHLDYAVKVVIPVNEVELANHRHVYVYLTDTYLDLRLYEHEFLQL